jgi:ferredoxin-NADP reductase
MLDADVLRDLLGDLESFHFMIAGPPPMAKSVEGSLLEAGLSEDQVQSDSFSGY